MAVGFPLDTYSLTRKRSIPGARQHASGDQIIYGLNKESTASMPFGLFVVYERTTLQDAGMLNPDAITDKLAGVTIHSYDYAKEQLGLGTAGAGTAMIGVLPTFTVNVITRGYVLCVLDASQTTLPGDPVFVRCVATGAEVEGAVRTTADASDCIDLTGKAVFRSSQFTAPNGELVAWVELLSIAT